MLDEEARGGLITAERLYVDVKGQEHNGTNAHSLIAHSRTLLTLHNSNSHESNEGSSKGVTIKR
eukprot:scaffold65308_cov39-Tisochrysis_lutea.AAC.2